MVHGATDIIRADHRKVDQLYQRYLSLNGQAPETRGVAEQICHELEVHAALEEGIFYPAVQAKLGEDGKDQVIEALKEHNEMKRLIGQLRQGGLDARAWDETVHALMQGVHHHVREEEREMLPQAEQRLGSGELGHLGAQMQQKKQALQQLVSSESTPGQGTLAQRITPADHETNGASPIEESIEVNVPVHTAYNQWTQFEEFPRFMEGVEQVRQLDNTHLHWRAKVGGKEKEWEAVITEQIPDQRIAWTNTTGARNAGVVMFHRLADNKTRLMLQLAYDSEGVVENVGDAIGVVSSRVRGDLRRFKEFIEARGTESGAWRGTVEQPYK
jgi:uncharacterized membrane protein